jgi:hypothetical protein
MNKEEYEWGLMDDSCSQYRKRIDETTYMLIEYVLLPNDKCIVTLSEIDLNDFSQAEIEEYVSYYYTSMEELDVYGNDRNGIISECIFEQICWDEHDDFWEIETEELAKAFIEEKIKSI